MKKILMSIMVLLLLFSLCACDKHLDSDREKGVNPNDDEANRSISCWEIAAPEGAITNQEKAILFIADDGLLESVLIGDEEIKGKFPVDNYLLQPGVHEVTCCLRDGGKVWMHIQTEAGKYYYLDVCAAQKDYTHLHSAQILHPHINAQRTVGAFEIEAPEGAISDQENAILFIDKDEQGGIAYLDGEEIKAEFPLKNYLLKPGKHEALIDTHNHTKWSTTFTVEAGKYYYLCLGAIADARYTYLHIIG